MHLVTEVAVSVPVAVCSASKLRPTAHSSEKEQPVSPQLGNREGTRQVSETSFLLFYLPVTLPGGQPDLADLRGTK